MKLRAMVLAVAGAAIFALPAAAHHSFAMFDQTRIVMLEGTVSEFEWINPHSWLHFMAMGENGQAQEFSIELASVAQQTRIGWTADTVKAGDKVVVEYNPLKDGTRGGTLVRITLPDGRTLGHGGNPANPIGNNN